MPSQRHNLFYIFQIVFNAIDNLLKLINRIKAEAGSIRG